MRTILIDFCARCGQGEMFEKIFKKKVRIVEEEVRKRENIY